MSDSRINMRVDKDLKENAELLFKHLGINLSSAISIFLIRAVEEQGIPFNVTTRALSFGKNQSAEQVKERFQNAVAKEINDSILKEKPIAKYDLQAKRAYLEYPDGTKEYIVSE